MRAVNSDSPITYDVSRGMSVSVGAGIKLPCHRLVMTATALASRTADKESTEVCTTVLAVYAGGGKCAPIPNNPALEIY